MLPLWSFTIRLMIHKSTKSTHFGFFKLLPLGTVLRFDHVIMAVMLDDLMNTWSVVVPAVTDLGAWYLAIPIWWIFIVTVVIVTLVLRFESSVVVFVC